MHARIYVHKITNIHVYNDNTPGLISAVSLPLMPSLSAVQVGRRSGDEEDCTWESKY